MKCSSNRSVRIQFHSIYLLSMHWPMKTTINYCRTMSNIYILRLYLQLACEECPMYIHIRWFTSVKNLPANVGIKTVDYDFVTVNYILNALKRGMLSITYCYRFFITEQTESNFGLNGYLSVYVVLCDLFLSWYVWLCRIIAICIT